ncbi:DUF922 domain-containing protein [Cytophaga aurantiaca]|uniref:DUF922 domain-containing protein n=1 Tax=Cytophaga aurantiaca TaxID=29530 RepID=UPI00037A697C|nr:DUF922 domain-containing protein [Cytophaga aurantiaca]
MVRIVLILSCLLFSSAFVSTDGTQFSWSSSRKLTWADFKGKPDKLNPAAALTYSDIKIGASYIDGKVAVQVQNFFDTKLSWSKNKTSVPLLAHEQVHFDITEIYTRKIRLKLNVIASEETIRNGTLNKESSILLKEWKSFQKKYDDETNHGILAAKQKEWQEQVAALLKTIQ